MLTPSLVFAYWMRGSIAQPFYDMAAMSIRGLMSYLDDEYFVTDLRAADFLRHAPRVVAPALCASTLLPGLARQKSTSRTGMTPSSPARSAPGSMTARHSHWNAGLIAAPQALPSTMPVQKRE